MLHEWLIVLGMIGIGAMVLFSGAGLDRSFAIHSLLICLMVVSAAMFASLGEWMIFTGWGLVCVNVLRRPYPMQHQPRLALMCGLTLFYILFATDMTPFILDHVLMGMVLLSLALVGAWFKRHILTQHETYLDTLLTIGIACTVALLMKGYFWFGLALIPQIMPLFLYRDLSSSLQAHIWLFGIAAMVAVAWMPVLIVFPIMVGAAWYWTEPIPLGGTLRWRAWRVLLAAQWQSGWTARLFGMGHDAWLQWADSLAGLEKQVTGKAQSETLLNPHNEYVSVLFEHGIIGLLIFLTWLGSLAWNAYQHDPVLLIPGFTVAAIALTLFPWSFPREIPLGGLHHVRYEPLGHMAPLFFSLVIAILLRGAS